MDFANCPMNSLQRQALTNFASSVWVRANTNSFGNHGFNYESMNDRAIAELKRSNTATNIKEMTMMILPDVGREIFDWFFYIIGDVNDITRELQLSKLSWTVEGRLNRQKMARLLLEDETDLDWSFSFRMACEYCLEDKVRILLRRARKLRQRPRNLNRRRYDFDTDLMIKYWIYKLRGRFGKRDIPLFNVQTSRFWKKILLGHDETSYDVKFFFSSFFCSFETVKLLFNNLSEEGKSEALDIFKSSFHQFSKYDEMVFGYLLSQLNFGEICDILSKYDNLKMLLTKMAYLAWPNTEFVKAFDQRIGKMTGTMEDTNGNDKTDMIKLADGAFECVRRYNQMILFQYCWSRFPKEELNKEMEDTNSSFLHDVLEKLIDNQDRMSVIMVINSIEPKGYAKKLLSRKGYDIIDKLDECGVLEYYLACTVNSKNLAQELRIISKTYPYFAHHRKKISDILNKMYSALDSS